MLLNHVLLAALWVLYCVLHSVLASRRVKIFVQSRSEKVFRYYRLSYTLFAALSLAAVVWFQLSIATVFLFPPFVVADILGGITAVTGLLIMFICIKKYFLSLSGLKSLVQERPSATLMISGIHRYLRHPLYLGTFLFLWGVWLITPTLSLLIANSIITAYTVYAIRLEEKKLVQEFGEQYIQYQKEVPKLLPRFRLAETGGRHGR